MSEKTSYAEALGRVKVQNDVWRGRTYPRLVSATSLPNLLTIDQRHATRSLQLVPAF